MTDRRPRSASPEPAAGADWLPAGPIVALGFVGALAQIYGGTWDISWHIDRGRESFFSLPHLVLYAGIILTLTATSIALTATARGGGSIAARLRSAPVVGAIVLATLFQLSSAPFDEFWHRAFGRDVGVWSPPHFVLIFGAATTFFALAALQLRRIKIAAAAGGAAGWERAMLIALITFGTAMLVGTVIENDFPGIPAWHSSQQRPAWVHPAIVTVASAFGLTIAARIGGIAAGGAWAGAILMAIRWTSAGLLALGGATAPHGPILLVAGGLAIDLLLGPSPLARRLARRGPILAAVLAGLAYPIAIWATAPPWLALTRQPGPSTEVLIGAAPLLLLLGVVGVAAGGIAAAGLDRLADPRPEPAVAARRIAARPATEPGSLP